MVMSLRKSIVNCDRKVWFRTECRENGNPVAQVKAASCRAVHVVEAAAFLPHPHYDLVVRTAVNGVPNVQVTFSHLNLPSAVVWTTCQLQDMDDVEKLDSANVTCGSSAVRATVRIDSTAEGYKKTNDQSSNLTQTTGRVFSTTLDLL